MTAVLSFSSQHHGLDANENFRRKSILETWLSWKILDVSLVRKLYSNEMTSIQKCSYYIFSLSVMILSKQWLFPWGVSL